jgi:cell division protein FtsI (penicillin-binding protein 3)
VRFDTSSTARRDADHRQSATISDAHPHGALTVAQVIQKSSNVGTAKIAAMLRPSRCGHVRRGRLRAAAGLGFPGEVTGRLRPWKSWRPIEQATMSYGHGISVSLMQLARAYTVFRPRRRHGSLSLTKTDGMPWRRSRCSASRRRAKCGHA